MTRQSRNTKQKETIESALLNIDSFFNAKDLYLEVHKVDQSIGLATIYRFLKGAQEKRTIYSYMCGRRTIYSKGKRSHCHFECEKTGKVIHFDVDNIDFLKNKIPGKITSFQLEVKGICEECTKSD